MIFDPIYNKILTQVGHEFNKSEEEIHEIVKHFYSEVRRELEEEQSEGIKIRKIGKIIQQNGTAKKAKS